MTMDTIKSIYSSSGKHFHAMVFMFFAQSMMQQMSAKAVRLQVNSAPTRTDQIHGPNPRSRMGEGSRDPECVPETLVLRSLEFIWQSSDLAHRPRLVNNSPNACSSVAGLAMAAPSHASYNSSAFAEGTWTTPGPVV
eukprot:2089634-Amphidinium_carterae.4